MKKYKTILADPPWEQLFTGKYKRRPKLRKILPYPTMSIKEIKSLPVNDLAEDGCHLWLWVTNAFLPTGFDVMKTWGFKYLAPITWVKPSGLGNYFIHTTQHILFGYKNKCIFPLERYKRTDFSAQVSQNKHSRKPEVSYELIKSISPEPRLELFARPYDELWPNRPGWDQWGNEIENSIELSN